MFDITTTMTVRYAVGDQERDVLVLTQGLALSDHVERLQNAERPWVTFALPEGGGIGLRISAIVALEFPL
ncbi:hypothetical protein ACFCXP_37665 [Streptomyces niveus]|uniref:hypothetical protein n=1 Tax=Streptomyces niveus TaxID=193462 RepID=UPI0035E2973D